MIPPQLIAEIITHIIAFLLLFWVVKAFAWRPVLRILDERNRMIGETIGEAEEKEREANELRREYQARLDRIEDEARARMNEAIEQGRRISDEIAEKARGDAREIRDKAKRANQMEIDQARIELKNRMIALTLAATERLLREQLDDPKQREIIAHFIEDLEARKA
jgi:F-type H+-transporting ATPase subunit b